MRTVNRKKENLCITTGQGFVAFVLVALVVLAGCSKGDNGPAPFVDLKPTTTNTNNTGGTNQGIGVAVTIKSIDPPSPATLKFGDSIAITYDYNVTRSLGARIWIQPFANGNLTLEATYSASPVFKGTGTETAYVSISEGDTIVLDQLKTKVNTAGFILLGVLTGSSTLSEEFEDVDYLFAD